MGVSKGEGGGGDHPRKGVRFAPFCAGGPCRIWRSVGFPKLSRKIFPLKPFLLLPQPLFLLLDPLLQFFLPSNAFLQLSRPDQKSLFYPLKPSFALLPLLKPLLALLRTPSESLHRVHKRP